MYELPKQFQTLLTGATIYPCDTLAEELAKIDISTVTMSTKDTVIYYDIPMAFDIETSSFYNKEQQKVAIMYVWKLGVFGKVFTGRTWDEAIQAFDTVSKWLYLRDNQRAICYIHNLGFEFQFMRKHFEWAKIFAIKPRTPIYAISTSGIEFRCSYILTGRSLESVGDNLHKYKVKKLVGDLDYSKIRHAKTPITEKENQYGANDVRVVMAHIAECIEAEGGISHIPLTKTGYVRRYCRNNCFKDPKYRPLIENLTLTPNEYRILKRAFAGGFTHANPLAVDREIYDVTSYDITSSYPTVMAAERFPMSKGEKYTPKSPADFRQSLKLYCCVFDIIFTGLKPKVLFDNYISIYHCRSVKNPIVSNGRVVSADELATTITDVDFDIIQKFYTWESSKVFNMYRYRRGYLPTPFVASVLELYKNKTVLKGVQGKENEYGLAKEMCNSCYGMCVTDIVQDSFEYNNDNDEWEEMPKNLPQEIAKYNSNKGRFLFYPWGVFVCAYARRNLFTAICEANYQYLYADTDSVKIINETLYKEFFERYNKQIMTKLRKAMDYHDLSYDYIEPKTIEGIPKPLGVWDFDGHYSKFKTLGAKRYLGQYSNDPRNPTKKVDHFLLTVAGLPKKQAVDYLTRGNKDIFREFTHEMEIPAEETGKRTHTYIDEERNGIVTDYLGNTAEYHELSSLHIDKAEFTLKLSQEFIDYLEGIHDEII